MKGNKKIILAICLVVVVCVVAYVIKEGSKSSGVSVSKPTLKTYSIKYPAVSFSYPSFLNVLQQNDETNTSSTTLVFSSGKNQILFIVSQKSSLEAEKQRASLEKMSSKDGRSRLSSDKITIGDFSGFKFLLDFEKSRYVLFKDYQGMVMVVESEIAALSDKELPDLEAILVSIISSIH